MDEQELSDFAKKMVADGRNEFLRMFDLDPVKNETVQNLIAAKSREDAADEPEIIERIVEPVDLTTEPTEPEAEFDDLQPSEQPPNPDPSGMEIQPTQVAPDLDPADMEITPRQDPPQGENVEFEAPKPKTDAPLPEFSLAPPKTNEEKPSEPFESSRPEAVTEPPESPLTNATVQPPNESAIPSGLDGSPPVTPEPSAIPFGDTKVEQGEFTSPLSDIKIETPEAPAQPPPIPRVIQEATDPVNLELTGSKDLDTNPAPERPIPRPIRNEEQVDKPKVRPNAPQPKTRAQRQAEFRQSQQPGAFPFTGGGFNANIAARAALSTPVTGDSDVTDYGEQMADDAQAASESLVGTLSRISAILLTLKSDIDDINAVLDRSFGG